MTDRTDPDLWRDLRDRKAALDEEFRLGLLREPVYRAKLFGLGFRGQEIDIEVRLNR